MPATSAKVASKSAVIACQWANALGASVIGTVGTKVTVNCFTHGSTVLGDSIWYHVVKPHNGFVAGFYLGTGGDPAAGIRHC